MITYNAANAYTMPNFSKALVKVVYCFLPILFLRLLYTYSTCFMEEESRSPGGNIRRLGDSEQT